MNKVYRIVWNAAQAAWQVVGEFGSRRGKQRDRRARRRQGAAGALLAGTLVLIAPAALGAGLPGGGQVSVGEGRIDASQNAMTVTQHSDRMAINWERFSIGEHASVEFRQPSETSIALNRVLGSDVSAIQGALSANGRVFLINPNGVLFSGSAMVDVGGLVASTLDLSDQDFVAGNHVFEGDSPAAVVNRGQIDAAGGAIALIAARVENTGNLTANEGSVLLGAGRRLRLDLGGPVKLEVEEAALDALIEQGGAIRADGGTVLLTAKAAGDLANTVINHTGISEARTLQTGANGEILLLGGGGVNVAGTVDASAPNGGAGGFIETSGARVSVDRDARVTTLGTNGEAGTWLIDPTDLYVQADCSGSPSACIEAGTIDVALGFNNMVFETYSEDTGAHAGDIFINSNLTYTGTRNASLHFRAHRDISIADGVQVEATRASLNTILQANRDGEGGGVIDIGTGASINTNGGHLILTGGVIPLLSTDPLVSDMQAVRTTGYAEGREGATTGISIGAGATLDSTGGEGFSDGDIVLRGRAYSATGSEGRALSIDGTSVNRVTLKAGDGQLEIHNDGNQSSSALRLHHADLTAGNESFALAARSRFGTALDIAGVSFNLAVGELSLDGQRVGSAGGSGAGIRLRDTDIATAGNVSLVGRSHADDAILMDNVDITVSDSGSISIDGRISHTGGSGRGVRLDGSNNRLQTGAGEITIDGYARRNVGLAIDGYELISGEGSISLRGEHEWTNSSNLHNGLTLTGTEVRTDSGDITVHGRTNHGSRTGLVIAASTDILSSSGGIRLEGRNTGTQTSEDRVGMRFDGRVGAAPGSTVTSSRSDITLLADRWRVDGAARAQSAGHLVIAPYGSGGMSIGNAHLYWLNVPVAFLEEQIHGFGHVFLGGGPGVGVSATTFTVDQAVELGFDTEILTLNLFNLAQNLTTSHDLGIGHGTSTSESDKYRIFSGRSLNLTAPETQAFRLGPHNDLDSHQYNLISTAAQLQNIEDGLGGLHALANDIDAIGDFVALGNADTPFSGTFAGLGHTLSGYTVDAPDQDDQGLFGVIDSAVIRNVRINGASVAGRENVGLLVGRSLNGQVLSSRIAGGAGSTVDGNLRVGGMVGSATATDIRSQDSEWTVSVDNATVNISGTGSHAGGGLVGAMDNGGSLRDVSASNTVIAHGAGASDIGGLVGYAQNVDIRSSSTGDNAELLSSGDQSNMGGLIGRMDGGHIQSSHATGQMLVSSDMENVGGLVGHLAAGTLASSYRNTLDVGEHDVYRSGGLVGFNQGTVTGSWLAGDMTARGTSVGGLVGMNDSGGLVTGQSHLRANVTVLSGDSVGGLVGHNLGTLQDSFVQYAVWNDVTSGSNPVRGTRDITLDVSGIGNQVGGLVGRNEGTIRRTYGDMTVSAAGYIEVGGVTGANLNGGQIEDSYFLSMSHSDNAQITGGNRGISGADFVGGLVGINSSGSIVNSYAAASVNASGPQVGGLVGYNGVGADVTGSFWDMDVTGAPQASAAGTGLTTAQMMDRNTFLNAGWDLSNLGGDGTTWRIFDDSGTHADEYAPQTRPMLRTFLRQAYNVGGSWSIEYDGNDYGWIDGPASGTSHTNQIHNPDTNNQIYGEGVLGRMDNGGFKARNAGTHALEFSGAYYSHQHGYDISYAQNRSLTIEPRQIRINVISAEDKIFDATSRATVNVSASRSGIGSGNAFISGDDVAFDFDGGGTFASGNVGSNIDVYVAAGNFRLVGEDSANYVIHSSVLGSPATANITPAQVTAIGGAHVADREYDGTRDVDAFDLSDLTITVNGLGTLDPESPLYQLLLTELQIAGENQYGSANAGTYNLSIGTGDISLKTSDSANFGLNLSSGFSIEGVTITPRTLVFAGGDFLAEKIYDGTTSVEEEHLGGELQFDNLVDGEVLEFSLVNGSFGYVNVGSYNNVALELSVDATDGTTASNYRIGDTNLGGGSVTLNGLSGKITPRELIVELDKGGQFIVADRVYDGTTGAEITDSSGLFLQGLVGDEYFALQGASAVFAQSDAGEDVSASLDALELGTGFNGALAMNYSLSLEGAPSTTAAITPRPVEVTADHASRVYGEANPTLGYSAEAAAEGRGLLEGDSLSGSLATAATAGSGIGSYAITEGSLANANYAIEFTNGTLTITPRPVQVAADGATRTYGDEDPALTYSVEGQSGGRGLLKGDGLDGALTREGGENVGSYAITQGTLTDAANPNYSIEFTGADLEITRRTIKLAADLVSRIYGESDPTLSVSVVGGSLASGSVADTLEDVVGALTRAAGEDVGQYHVLLGEGASAGNYAIAFDADNGAFSITPRPVKVTSHDVSRVYGEANPTLGYSAEAATEGRGLLEGDSLSGSLATTANAGSNVGSYDITRGTLANANYEIHFAPDGKLTITPRPVQVTANDTSRVYGEANPSLGYSAEAPGKARGLLDGDSFSGSLATSAAAGSGVGDYAITEGSLANANYTVEFRKGTLTITPRPVQVAANASTRTYGDEDPALSYSVEAQSEGRGLLEGESLDGALVRETGEDVGSYAITRGTLTDAANPNYAVEFTGADLEITRRAIELAADLVSRVYGDSDPQLSVSLVGGSLASGSVSDTLEEVVGALTRVAGEDVGQYHVLLGEGASTGNYAIAFDADNGAFSITPRPVTVAADDQGKIYGQRDPALTWRVVDGELVGDDTLAGQLARGPGEAVGRYTIKAGSLGNPNYAMELVEGTLVIRPQQQSEVLPDAIVRTSPLRGPLSPASAAATPAGAASTGGLLLVDVTEGDSAQAAGGIVRDRDGRATAGYMPVLVVNGGIHLPAGAQTEADDDGESL